MISAYAAGLQQGMPRRWGATVEGSSVVDVAMPGAIRDEILSIGVSFKMLDKAVDAARARLPADFVSSWSAFNAEWKTFSGSHERWIDNLWYKSYEKALEYRRRLDEWRQRLEALTGTRISFPMAAATPGPAEKKGVPWRALGYGALAIGGLYALSKALSSAAELKREVVGHTPIVGGAA